MSADWGAIFDWDGVIVDSSGPHEASWKAVASEAGCVFPDEAFLRGFGMKNQTIIGELLRWTDDPELIQRWSARKEELYREIIRREGLGLLPGARELLAALKDQGIPCAVASSTPLANITCVLDVLHVRPYFSAIVTSEDVSRGKPDPHVFLLASQRLGLPPQRCVVFEDAPVGIQAARAAGMRAVGFTTTHPAEWLSGADQVVKNAAHIRLDDVHRLLQHAPPAAL